MNVTLCYGTAARVRQQSKVRFRQHLGARFLPSLFFFFLFHFQNNNVFSFSLSDCHCFHKVCLNRIVIATYSGSKRRQVCPLREVRNLRLSLQTFHNWPGAQNSKQALPCLVAFEHILSYPPS